MKRPAGIIAVLLWAGVSGQTYSLEDCVNEALKNKVTVQSAALSVKSAQIANKSAWGNALPSLALSGGYSQSTMDTAGFSFTGSGWSSGVSIRQPIFEGGNILRQISLGKRGVAIAEATERAMITNVILEVQKAYYDLLKGQHLLEAADQDLELALQQLELVRNQYRLGAVKITDVLKAQVRLGQARTVKITRKTAMDNARRSLANAMGMMTTNPAFSIKEITDPLPDVPELDESRGVMEARNPQLIAKKIDLVSREIKYKIALGAHFPTLSAGGSYSTSAEDAASLVNNYTENWRWTGSLSLSYPLFTGFKTNSARQQAKLDLQTARNDYKTLVDDLTVGLAATIEGLSNYKEIIPILEEVQLSAEKDLKLVKERYALGSATILEVLDAQVSVTQARINLINTTYDALSQNAGLKATLGILDTQYNK